MIINKIDHNIEIKKISIEMWTLRTEIDTLVRERLKKALETNTKLNIQEIRNYYGASSNETIKASVSNIMSKSSQEEINALTDDQLKDTNQNTDLLRKRLNIPQSEIVHGVLFLSEISMDRIYLFSESKFTIGQTIAVQLKLSGRTIILGAMVERCSEYNMRSKIISKRKPNYRIKCRFTFDTIGERELLRSFLNSISESPLEDGPLKLVSEENTKVSSQES